MVTACATGTNAIGEAMRAIRHGYADAVITGGSEAAISECGVAGFVNMQALSTSEDPDAACLPFDKRRGRFRHRRGGAALVLEEYEHAVARGAKIYGEVVGYGATCDAFHITAPGRTAPAVPGPSSWPWKRPAGAGGDRVHQCPRHRHPHERLPETQVVKLALGGGGRPPCLHQLHQVHDRPLPGAAGAIEAIACLKALEEGVLPPHHPLRGARPRL